MLYSSIKSIISNPHLSHLSPIHQIYHLYPLYRIYKKQKREPSLTPSVKDWRRPTFPQTSAVSSAMRGLTSLFGMGRGEHSLYRHQNVRFNTSVQDI